MGKSLPARIVGRAVVTAHDLGTDLGEALHRLNPPPLPPTRRRPGGRAGAGSARRIAIVSAWPTEASARFAANLLRVLAERDFITLLVCTRPLVGVAEALLVPLSSEVIERPNTGRDFGSYHWGLAELAADAARLMAAELLLLANDSLYWPRGFGAELDRMLADPAPWQGLFENHQYHTHLGSFFQLFRRPVFAGEAFRRFWAAYRPSDVRRHVVNRGEVRLSAALRDAGLVPGVAFDAARLREALRASPLRLDWLPDGGFPGLTFAELARRHGQAPLPASVTEDFVAAFARLNPTQVGALACHALFGAPLKRDLAWRGIFGVDRLLAAAGAFDASERAAMRADLEARGTRERLPWHHRVLVDAGRL